MRTSILLSLAFLLLLPADSAAQDNAKERSPADCDISLALADLKNSLELSNEQETVISGLYREYKSSRKSILEEFPEDNENDRLSRQIEIRRLNRATEAKIIDILSSDQIESFNLIMEKHRRATQDKQRENRDSEEMVMMNKRLGLSAGQEEKVGAILSSRSEKIRLLMGERKGERGRLEAVRESIEKIDDDTEKKLSVILTDAQMKEYGKIRDEEREKMKAHRRPPGRKGDRPEGGRPDGSERRF
ncbi:MAG: hypothetical protein JW746_09150 [Candidatus Krumholzibacteriota bacterium]|nr:hypothetical protein [Candidatus Krumholzibacteriota bacterium]